MKKTAASKKGVKPLEVDHIKLYQKVQKLLKQADE
jgi:hypothetical protein